EGVSECLVRDRRCAGRLLVSQIIEAEAVVIRDGRGCERSTCNPEGSHGRVLVAKLLGFAAGTADLTQLVILTGKALTVAQLGMDLHQFQSQVDTMRLVVDGVLQQFGSLIETA